MLCSRFCLQFVVSAMLLALTVAVASAAERLSLVVKPDVAGYKDRVAPLFAKYCLDCHGPDDPEGKLSLHSIDADLLHGDDFESWRLIEDRVAFREMPPEDYDQPTAVERAALLGWVRGELRKTMLPGVATQEKLSLPQYGNYVDHQALFGARLDRVYPSRPRIWRLRPDIYDRTMPRIHSGGRVSGLANGLNVLDGSQFKDYAAPYFVDEAAATPLLGNAKKIAEALVGKQSRLKACKQSVDEKGPPSEETVIEAINQVFHEALGRQPTDEERERFKTFYDKAVKTGGYVPAGKALITAVLMQPEMLYRQELGDGEVDEYGRMRLSQREIAYALSYALDNEPVDAFIHAAQEGKLATAEQIASLVRERLKDDSILQRKNPRVMQFFREYFHYPFAREVFKDQPEGGEHEPGMLVRDLELTIHDVLRADKDVLAELLTTRKYYVKSKYKEDKKNNLRLHEGHHKHWSYPTAYNLPYDWKWTAERQPVKFRKDERAGVLTHPAWLAAWSGNFENHPVQRGKWIRTHLLGGTVPDVPIGVDARVPEAEHKSFRQRLEMTTGKAECWRCHKKMDPLGVAFERYDHYGRYQRLDAGQPVDASAKITRTGVPELDGIEVGGPTELVDKLAESPYVEQVFVRHVFRYFLGRNETLGDANTLQDAYKAYRDSGGSFRALVVSLLSSDSFLLRQVGPPAAARDTISVQE